MKLSRKYVAQLSHLIVLLTAILTANAAEKFVWTEGHGDLAVNYVNGTWDWTVEQGEAIDTVIIRLNDTTRNAIPDNAAFSFLGAPGDPIWIIPAAQTAGVPYLGINAERTPNGTFVNDRLDLFLSSIDAPGDFIVWTTTGTGTPTLLMNSRDGITATDRTDVPAGGHFHQNWGFSSPGTYRVGFKASGVLVGQPGPTNSEEAIYTFEVNVLKSGEVDIEVAYEGGALEFHVHDEAADVEFEPAQMALQAGPATWQTVPQGTAFSFLGNPGASIYVLPQEEKEGILALGLAAAEVSAGVFANDRLTVKLVSVEGPGKVAYYETDQFGIPTVVFNSGDGITAADAVTVVAGSHAHRNWSFSAPGVYQLTLQASGTLAAGGEIPSEPATFLFEVTPPEFAEEGELDFEAAFEDGALELGFHDHAAERELSTAEVVLVLRPAAKSAVPNDPGFSFLGKAGTPIYVVPQDEKAGLLFLGIAGEEIDSSLFTGEIVKLELVSTIGPGSFSLYSVDSFGKPTVFMNSGDGVSSADLFSIPVGSHTHLNWAFTKAGEYELTIKASGTLIAGNQPIASDPVTLRFLVQEQTGGPALTASLRTNPRQLQLSWEARTGVSYQLQSRSSLSTGNWLNEGVPIPGISGLKTMSVELGTERLKIFRLVESQP